MSFIILCLGYYIYSVLIMFGVGQNVEVLGGQRGNLIAVKESERPRRRYVTHCRCPTIRKT